MSKSTSTEQKTGVLTRRLLIAGAGAAGVAAVGAVVAKDLYSPPAKLNLNGYKLTFSEEFNGPDFSTSDLLKRWYPHTPWHGDFGDAQFVDPTKDFPFTQGDGNLRIEARKNPDGKWQSGLLASLTPEGRGFSQQYGYFEMRAKLPPGPGVWPAFWLDSMVPASSPDPSIEVDVIEYYGQFPEYYHSTVHIWPKGGGQHTAESKMLKVEANALTSAYHTYGVSVEADWIITYLDGVEMWRTPTPAQHKHKLMILVNLALGSGWPIDKTINPSVMYVDYIRAYEKG